MSEQAFNLRASLTSALHTDLDVLRVDSAANSRLYFGHVCCGRLEKPDALRLTAVLEGSPRGSFLKNATKRARLADAGQVHAKVFREHIKLFGRESVLLEWLSDWAYHSKLESVASDLGSFTIFWGSCEQGILRRRRAGSGSLSIGFGERLLEELVPSSVVHTYLKQLYKWVHAMKSSKPQDLRDAGVALRMSKRILMAAAVNAFRMVKEDRKAWATAIQLLRAAGRDCSGNDKIELTIFSLLASFQTGFMMIKAARSFKGGYLGAVSTILVFGDMASRKGSIDRIPLGLVSGMAEAAEGAGNLESKLKEQLLKGDLRRELSKLEHRLSSEVSLGALPDIVSDNLKVECIQPVLEALVDADGGLSASPVPAWPIAIGLWLAAIIEKLRDAVHEGSALSFTFLVADRSVLEDGNNFDLISLRQDSVEIDSQFKDLASPFRHPDDVRKRIDAAVRQLKDNNYAWFSEGRYALLWDSTLPEASPSALVALRGSSWDVFVASCRRSNPPEYSDATGMVFYVRRDGSGGMLAQGRSSLAFVKGREWQAGYAKREGLLRESLLSADRGLQPIIDSLVGVCMAVSTDPGLGCMLVIWKGGEEPGHFRKMGKLWELQTKDGGVASSVEQLSEQELIALMGMDGATCLWRAKDDNWNVCFRRLVQGPSMSGETSLDEGDQRKHLEGQGSRKWSGALTATHNEVSLVVAISQDGPIFVIGSEEILGKVAWEGEDLIDKIGESETRRIAQF